MCLVKTNATECLFYSKVWLEIRPVAKLVHYYVCQEIFTVIQLKNICLTVIPEDDRSSQTKATLEL